MAQKLLNFKSKCDVSIRGDEMMKSGSGLRSTCSGFTIIEVMVTCLIIAILGTIATASFSVWLPSYRLKAAVRDLYSTMQQAKMAAIKQHGNCTITYSTAPSHQYTATGVTKTVVLSEYGSGVKFAGPAGFATPNPPYDQAILTFNSRGMCTGPVGYAYLSNEKQTAHYRIGPVSTGSIKLERWNAENSQFQD